MSNREAVEKLAQLSRAGWSVVVHQSFAAGGGAKIARIEARRDLPGGNVLIEVEGANLVAAVDDIIKLCAGVVVTE